MKLTVLAIMLSIAFASSAKAATFCNSKFGIYAYMRLIPEDANPSGVTDVSGGRSQVMYKSERRATGFLCMVSLDQVAGTAGEKCPPLMDKKKLSEGMLSCQSKAQPLKKLCPDEIKTLRFGDELFKKYCHK